MPIDPKKTKNGVDLNEIDVSTMALVDKEGLLDELGKRLKQEIKDSVADAIAAAHEEIRDIISDVHSQTGPTGRTQTPPTQPGTPSGNTPTNPPRGQGPGPQGPSRNQQKSNNDFDKMVRDQAAMMDLLDKLRAQQKKKDKEKYQGSLKQNVYSQKGKGYAEDTDRLASGYQSMDQKELENAQKELADIQEGIRFTTFGKENKILTDATARLQKELAVESKKREGTLNRIGTFLDQEANINATSIITGILGNSPMMGLMTKATLEIFKHYKDKAQKKRAEQFKIGDLRKKLPRPNDPTEVENRDVKLDEENDKIFRNLAPKTQDQKHTFLEQALKDGSITQDQYDSLKKRLLPAGYTPTYAGAGQQQVPTPVAGQQTPDQQGQQEPPVEGPEIIPQKPLTMNQKVEQAAAGAMRRDKFGTPHPPRRTLDDHLKEAQAWKEQIFGPHRVMEMQAELKEAEEELERLKNSPQPSEDEDLFGNPLENAEGKVRSLKKQLETRQKVWGTPKVKVPVAEPVAEEPTAKLLEPVATVKPPEPITSNVRMMPTFDEQKKKRDAEFGQAHIIQMPVREPEQEPEQIERAALVQHPEVVENEEIQEHQAERLPNKGDEEGPNNVIPILKGMRKTEDDESKKLDVFSWRNRKNRLNPFLTIEKCLHDQLGELKAIRTLLDKQIDQADEAADASMRATKDKEKGGTGLEGAAVSEASLAKMLKKGGGGSNLKGGIAEMLLELTGAGSLLVKLKSFAGSLVSGVKGIASKIGNLFKGGGAEVAEGAEAVEGGAGAVEGGAAAAGGAAEAGAAAGGAAEVAGGAAGAAEVAGGIGAVGAAGLVAGTLAAAGTGIAAGHFLERKMDWYQKAEERGADGLSMLDQKSLQAEALNDTGNWKIPLKSPWYMPTRVWAGGIDSAWDQENKRNKGNDWFVHWLKSKHPLIYKKHYSDTDDKAKTVTQEKQAEKPEEKKPEPEKITQPEQVATPTPDAASPTPTKVFAPPNQNLEGVMTPMPVTSGGPGAGGPARRSFQEPPGMRTNIPERVGGGAGASGFRPDISLEQQKHIGIISEELKSQGMNEKQIAAIVGNVGKETGFSLRGENLNYSKTSNERIRSVFGKERTNMSDEDLNKLKSDPKAFAEAMYGKDTQIGMRMGNIQEGDGYKYRGRGYIQLTGKYNYARASKAIFNDERLVKDPDMVNKPEIAAKVLAWYMNSAGGQMAQQMGVDLKHGSQEDINLAYTSAVAGKQINRGQGYLGGEVMDKVDLYASAAKPQMMNNAPATDQGMRLTQASTEQRDLSRTLLASNNTQPSNVNTVIAPQNVTTNTTVQDVKAQNSESTYQRTMNSQYVST